MKNFQDFSKRGLNLPVMMFIVINLKGQKEKNEFFIYIEFFSEFCLTSSSYFYRKDLPSRTKEKERRPS